LTATLTLILKRSGASRAALPFRLLRQLAHAGHLTAISVVTAPDKRPIDSLSQTA
jgi:hypothetical protein